MRDRGGRARSSPEGTARSPTTFPEPGYGETPVFHSTIPNPIPNQRSRMSRLQLPFQEILNHVKQMHPVGRPGDSVRLIGIGHEPELLARLDERLAHLDTILKVHVVIA